MKLIIIVLLCTTFIPAFAAESDYVNKHCTGQTEVVLPDRTRVDCLTDEHAIEFDYGRKWAEAIGQSLHYAMHTGRRAGIILIVGPSEQRFVRRVKFVINHYNLPIDVWDVPL